VLCIYREWSVSPAADLTWRAAASISQLESAVEDFERQAREKKREEREREGGRGGERGWGKHIAT
jgi:hypothetical protein